MSRDAGNSIALWLSGLLFVAAMSSALWVLKNPEGVPEWLYEKISFLGALPVAVIVTGIAVIAWVRLKSPDTGNSAE